MKSEIEAKLSKAEQFIQEGKELAAVQIYKQLIDEEKELPRTVLRLANLYEKMMLFDNVSNLLEEYLEKNEDDEVTFLYGQFLIRRERYSRAVEIFENLISRNAEFIDSFYFLAIANLRLKNIEKAKKNFIEYLENKGERYFVPTIFQLVKILNSTSDYDEALKYLDILERKGGYDKAKLNFLRSEAYYGIGMYYYAQDFILKALKHNGENPVSLLLAARVHMHIGEYDVAKDFLERLITIDNENASAYALLGFVSIAKKNFDDAKKYLADAIKLNPYEKDVIILKNKLLELIEVENREG